MTAVTTFHTHLAMCPLVAILRGVRPAEVVAIGEALFEEGIRIIEVPLNSPDPLSSIERLASHLGHRATVGAGTVLKVEEVDDVRQAGGRIIVSPSTDAEVIAATVDAGMASAPGYFTAGEAFTALKAGAHALKLFPAEGASPAVLKAHRAVLPADVPVLVVGGITPASQAAYLAAGASGFGLGSGIYRPGQSADMVRRQARAYVRALAEAGRTASHG